MSYEQYLGFEKFLTDKLLLLIALLVSYFFLINDWKCSLGLQGSGIFFLLICFHVTVNLLF